MGAYLNALREEGTRADLLREVERLWDERNALEEKNAILLRALKDITENIAATKSLLSMFDEGQS